MTTKPRFNSAAIIAFAFIVAAPAQSSAPTESVISSVSVEYASGARIEVRCDIGECSVDIKLHKTYRFTEAELSAKLSLDEQPVLYSENNVNDSFGFEVRLDCGQAPFLTYSRGRCYGNFGVVEGKLRDPRKFVIDGGRTIPVVDPSQ